VPSYAPCLFEVALLTHRPVGQTNAANVELQRGGGSPIFEITLRWIIRFSRRICGAIHAAAGPQLAAECQTLVRLFCCCLAWHIDVLGAQNGCATGQTKITKAYNLPCGTYTLHSLLVLPDGLSVVHSTCFVSVQL
jgi:hypothetical protein